MTDPLENFAVQALFESDVLGLAYADREQIIKLTKGKLADWIKIDGTICESVSALFGMKDEISDMRARDYCQISIPCVGFVTHPGSRGKVNVDVIWNAKLNGYLLLISPSDARQESNGKTTSQKRLKRIADELLQFNSEYLLRKRLTLAEANQLVPGTAESRPFSISGQKQPHAANPIKELTPREAQVVKLLVQGKANKMIAHTLHISEKTVEATRARAKKRLGVKTSADLIKVAVEHRIHDTD